MGDKNRELAIEIINSVFDEIPGFYEFWDEIDDEIEVREDLIKIVGDMLSNYIWSG